jgi:hypothetical protein
MTVDVKGYYNTFYSCYKSSAADLQQINGQQVRIAEEAVVPQKSDLMLMLSAWSDVLLAIFEHANKLEIKNLTPIQTMLGIINEIFTLTGSNKKDATGFKGYYSKLQQPLKAYLATVNVIIAKKDASSGVFDIHRDGNCLFRSIAHQLILHDPSSAQKHDKLRALAVDTIEKNRERFAHDIGGDLKTYTLTMRKEGVFAGHNEMAALMQALELNIVLVFKDSKREVELGDTAHMKIHLLYDPSPPGHYDSITCIETFRRSSAQSTSPRAAILKQFKNEQGGGSKTENEYSEKKSASFAPT